MNTFASPVYLCVELTLAGCYNSRDDKCKAKILDKITRNKKKIFNDPVYGFIHIPDPLLFDLIEHPYFQRLRRIRQLGLTSMVYPGANHTRFQHSLGTLHLMTQVLQSLRSKKIPISPEDELATQIAILLHDIGHGPFSHALEDAIIHDLSHEDLSLLIMEILNNQFDGLLEQAMHIFNGKTDKPFLYQLIVGQLDMDRLDYIQRDSFFSGVAEGTVGLDRIIKMLNVYDNELVIEEKGIYSIEKFILARRLMYWQVYFHKTVVSAEHLLMKILERAKELTMNGEQLFATPALAYFLGRSFRSEDIHTGKTELKKELVDHFTMLDDNDIMAAAKVWSKHRDKVLSGLCQRLMNRDLFHIEMRETPFDKDEIEAAKEKVMKEYHLDETQVRYFVFTDAVSNFAYSLEDHQIKILTNDQHVTDITTVSDILDQSIISRVVHRHILCYPKMNL